MRRIEHTPHGMTDVAPYRSDQDAHAVPLNESKSFFEPAFETYSSRWGFNSKQVEQSSRPATTPSIQIFPRAGLPPPSEGCGTIAPASSSPKLMVQKATNPSLWARFRVHNKKESWLPEHLHFRCSRCRDAQSRCDKIEVREGDDPWIASCEQCKSLGKALECGGPCEPSYEQKGKRRDVHRRHLRKKLELSRERTTAYISEQYPAAGM